MPKRRQEKVAHFVRDVVSDAIANHLSDPRIELAFVSVTRVDISADLRIANVYISVFGSTPAAQNNAYNAVVHARPRIQALLAQKINSRFCPVLSIHRDEQFKKALETIKLIDELSKQSNPSTPPDEGTKDEDSVDRPPQ